MDMPEYKDPQYCYRAEVTHVVDGDTIDILLDLGCNTFIKRRLRFLGIDAWETRGNEREQGLLAKQFVIDKLAEVNNIVTIQTQMDAEGKYGRLLAWVWLKNGETQTCLNEQLLLEGYAEEVNY